MIETAIIVLLIGLLWAALTSRARWRERFRAADKQNKATKKAHAIKNTIALDPDERERVRRHFDRP